MNPSRSPGSRGHSFVLFGCKLQGSLVGSHTPLWPRMTPRVKCQHPTVHGRHGSSPSTLVGYCSLDPAEHGGAAASPPRSTLVAEHVGVGAEHGGFPGVVPRSSAAFPPSAAWALPAPARPVPHRCPQPLRSLSLRSAASAPRDSPLSALGSSCAIRTFGAFTAPSCGDSASVQSRGQLEAGREGTLLIFLPLRRAAPATPLLCHCSGCARLPSGTRCVPAAVRGRVRRRCQTCHGHRLSPAQARERGGHASSAPGSVCVAPATQGVCL